MSKDKRLDILDVSRFLAAFSIMLFHYTFLTLHIYQLDFLNIEEVLFINVIEYGYLGVEFFFMLSGFVIFYSIKSSSSFEFVKARVKRLYPTYIIAVTLTFLAINSFAGFYRHIPLNEYFINLTMLQSFFNIQDVDGAYWTLAYEILFYGWIFLLLLFKLNSEKFYLLMATLFFFLASIGTVVEFPQIFKKVFLIEWSSYFFSGMLFFLIYKNRMKLNYLLLLSWGAALSLFYSNKEVVFMRTTSTVSHNEYVVFFIIMSIYIFMFLVATRRVEIKFKYAKMLGNISYPLYLIHQLIGYIFIYYTYEYLGLYSMLIAIITMLFVAFFINKYVEKLSGKKFKTEVE